MFILLVSVFIGILKIFTFSKEAREHTDYSNQQIFKHNHPLTAPLIDFAFSIKFPPPYNCHFKILQIKHLLAQMRKRTLKSSVIPLLSDYL